MDWLQKRWGSGRKLLNGEEAKPIKFSPLGWCLGRKVLIDEDEGIVVVKGPQYIDDMAKRYMTSEASIIVQSFKADVPCEEGISALSTTTTRQSVEAASLTRSLVQSLAYAAAKFKPEMLFHVGRLQRFADQPCEDVYKYGLQNYSSTAARTRSSVARGLASTNLRPASATQSETRSQSALWTLPGKCITRQLVLEAPPASSSRGRMGRSLSNQMDRSGRPSPRQTRSLTASPARCTKALSFVDTASGRAFRSLAPPNWRMTILGAYSSPATPRRCITPVLLPCARSSAKNASSSACSIPLTCRPAR